MSALKYRYVLPQPLALLGFGSHKLDGVRLYLCRSNAFWEGMLALPYGAWNTFSTAPHVLPKVPSRTTVTATRHQIMVTVNKWMNVLIVQTQRV